MSLGNKKAEQSQSPFSRVKNYTVDLGDLGQSTSTVSNGRLLSQFNPSTKLKNIQDTVLKGLNSNASYLSRVPEEQYAELLTGNNPYYNL